MTGLRHTSKMVPIGILSRNRAGYLDIMLRSLSATQLPLETPVVLYDDSSDDPQTLRYYETAESVAIPLNWPMHMPTWVSAGLTCVSTAKTPQGIKGRITIIPVAPKRVGVVNASCRAIRDLFQSHPAAPAVILLQDDVVFHADWYTRLCNTAKRSAEFTTQPLGLMAGCKLNLKLPSHTQLAVACGITAQCLYLTREAFEAAQTFFCSHHTISCRFDDFARRNVVDRGFWAGCIYPFVCQHFGVNSLVRPWKRWESQDSPNGRIGFYTPATFAMAPAVRQFRR